VPWQLTAIAFGLIVVTSLTFWTCRLLFVYWLATDGRAIVQAEVRRVLGDER